MVDSRLFRLDFAGGFPVAFGSFLEFIDCLRIKGIGHSLPGTLPGRPVFTLVIHLKYKQKDSAVRQIPATMSPVLLTLRIQTALDGKSRV